MLLTSLIIIQALIINLTNEPLRLQRCNQTIGYFIKPMSETDFIIVSYMMNVGNCYFTLGNLTSIELIWHYSFQTGREYYGIVHDDNVNVWIQIRGHGNPRYYLY
jgi:hypothetical protein